MAAGACESQYTDGEGNIIKACAMKVLASFSKLAGREIEAQCELIKRNPDGEAGIHRELIYGEKKQLNGDNM